jgi:undecaprenyl-diphosphatase
MSMEMTFIQAAGLAVLQGISELFPISSLGHAVVLPPLLGWSLDQHSPVFLPFLVALHLGTAVALAIYFRRDWLGLATAFAGRGERARRARYQIALIVVATIPAGLAGFGLEKWLRELFGSPALAAMFLVANGGLLFLGDMLRRRPGVNSDCGHSLERLPWSSALVIGICQCAALIPGISRSGATMVGSLLVGLGHAEAAHFSFLIALPIIVGVAILELPKLTISSDPTVASMAIGAGVIAGLTAYASTAFLMRYFRRHNFDNALIPFALYCIIAGAGALAALPFAAR